MKSTNELNLNMLIGKTITNVSSGLEGKIVGIENEDDFEITGINVLINNQTKYLSLKNIYNNGLYKFDHECSELIENVILSEKIKAEEAEKEAKGNKEASNSNVIDNFHLPETNFLSNFFSCCIEYKGKTYKNAEAAFQAQKCPNRADEFVNLNGAQAKRLGRQVKLRSDWDDVKLNIMKEIVTCKFTQNIDLACRLVLTGNRELVEGNKWNDCYWGVCRGKGENNLGKILMEIREKLQVSSSSSSNNVSFGQRVKYYLDGKGVTYVTGIKGNKYKVKLSDDKTKVELLDLPNLEPIDLSVFDEVERCLDNGITVKGSARSKVGSPNCDIHTIIGNIAYNCYGKHDGDTIVDATCYIYAILKSSGCIYIEDNEIKKCLCIIYNALIQ